MLIRGHAFVTDRYPHRNEQLSAVPGNEPDYFSAAMPKPETIPEIPQESPIRAQPIYEPANEPEKPQYMPIPVVMPLPPVTEVIESNKYVSVRNTFLLF